MKLKVFITIFLFINSQLFAQKKNEVSIFTHDAVKLRSNTFIHFLEQYGFSYERNINKNISVSASYSQWYVGSLPSIFRGYGVNVIFYYTPCVIDSVKPFYKCIGNTFQVSNYKYIDVSINYQKQLNKNYILKFGLAPSIAFGTNRILDTFFWYPPPSHLSEFKTHYEKGLYFGVVPRIEIGRKVWRNFYVYYFINFRKYFGFEINQIDNGFKIGYKF